MKFSKRIRSALKQEQFSQYPKSSPTGFYHLIQKLFFYNRFSIVINPVHLNSRETLNSLSLLPMTNTGNHLMATLNPAHLTDASGSYFVTGRFEKNKSQ